MKKLLIVVALSVILCACGGTKVTLKEKIEAEYGTELKVEDLTDQKGIKLKETKNYDAKKVGQQTITVIFTDEDEKEIEQEVTLEIKDTKAPEIKLKKEKVEITEGDKFDPASNIESVKDPIDGDIKKSDDKKITKNGYIITSDVDAKKVKNGYKVKVTAFDVNGNKAEKEYTVNVKAESKEKPQASTSQPTTSSGQAASAPFASQGGVSTGKTTASPSQPQQCVSNGQFGAIGNSGKVFVGSNTADGKAKAEAWAWAQLDQWADEYWAWSRALSKQWIDNYHRPKEGMDQVAEIECREDGTILSYKFYPDNNYKSEWSYIGFTEWTVHDNCEDNNEAWTVDFY